MKKFILMLLAALLVLGLASVAMAAPHWMPEDKGDECCTETWIDGVQQECDLGYEILVIEPTCQSNGKWKATCTKCGTSYFRPEAKDPTAHDWSDWTVVEATCETAGSKTRECTVPGCKAKEEVVLAAQHVIGEYVTTVKPTCQYTGIATATCSVCGDVFEKDVDKIKCNTNTVKVTVEATCTYIGLKDLYCDMCGDLQAKDVTIPKLNHKLVLGESLVQIVAPTCTTKGYYETNCSMCHNKFSINTSWAELTDAQKADLTIAALGHDMVGVEYPATCDKDGWKVFTCSRKGCTENYSIKLDKTAAHVFSIEEIILEATETSLGVKELTCENCGYTKSESFKLEVVEPEAPVEPETPADPEAPVEPETPVEPEAPAEDEDENDSEGTGSTTGNGSDASIPATGDNGNTMAYIMMVVAAAGLVVLAASKRKVNC